MNCSLQVLTVPLNRRMLSSAYAHFENMSEHYPRLDIWVSLSLPDRTLAFPFKILILIQAPETAKPPYASNVQWLCIFCNSGHEGRKGKGSVHRGKVVAFKAPDPEN
jgi:hypothetical protein